jgi:hypothetical protein
MQDYQSRMKIQENPTENLKKDKNPKMVKTKKLAKERRSSHPEKMEEESRKNQSDLKKSQI